MSIATTLLNIHGHAEAGKTVLALMIAEGLKTWPPPKGYVFTRVAHVGWDRDALAALRAMGIKVKHCLDMPALMSKPRPGENRKQLTTPVAAMLHAVHWLEKVATTDGKVDFVVEDTASRRNEHFHTMLSAKVGFDANARAVQRDVYGMLLALERQYYQGMAFCGIPGLICLFHTAIIQKEENEPATQTVRRQQFQMGKESVTVGPAMTGGGVRIYTAEPSLECHLYQVKDPKNPSKMLRYVEVETIKDKRTKNRFQEILEKKMLSSEFVEKYRKCVTL